VRAGQCVDPTISRDITGCRLERRACQAVALLAGHLRIPGPGACIMLPDTARLPLRQSRRPASRVQPSVYNMWVRLGYGPPRSKTHHESAVLLSLFGSELEILCDRLTLGETSEAGETMAGGDR